jgi:hypothetical protein
MPEIIHKAKCNYCGKLYARWNSAIKHELKCNYNPENQACVTCANLLATEVEQHYLAGGEDCSTTEITKQCDGDHDIETVNDFLGPRHERCLQRNCDFWEQRTVKGTVKFGRTKIEKV